MKIKENNEIREYLIKSVINELNNIRDFAQKMVKLDKNNKSFIAYDKILRDRLKELKNKNGK